MWENTSLWTDPPCFGIKFSEVLGSGLVSSRLQYSVLLAGFSCYAVKCDFVVFVVFVCPPLYLRQHKRSEFHSKDISTTPTGCQRTPTIVPVEFSGKNLKENFIVLIFSENRGTLG